MWKTDRETDKQLNDWGHRGYSREGSWATDQGFPPSPAFSIKPRHTGNNLWTRPSNSPTPTQPQEPTSPVSQLYQTKPRWTHLTPWPTTLTPSLQDKPNVTHAETDLCYIHNSTNAHTLHHVGAGRMCSLGGVSAYSLAQAQRWVIKKSNTVNAWGHNHINI